MLSTTILYVMTHHKSQPFVCFILADMSGWYADGAAPGMKRPSNMDPMMGGPDFKKRPHPGFGWGRQGPAPGSTKQ
jgi:hypothetical protein